MLKQDKWRQFRHMIVIERKDAEGFAESTLLTISINVALY